MKSSAHFGSLNDLIEGPGLVVRFLIVGRAFHVVLKIVKQVTKLGYLPAARSLYALVHSPFSSR